MSEMTIIVMSVGMFAVSGVVLTVGMGVWIHRQNQRHHNE